MNIFDRLFDLGGTHKHRCEVCKTIWEHGNDCALVDDITVHERAHQCPSCGATQYYKYMGPMDATHVGNCQRDGLAHLRQGLKGNAKTELSV